MEKKSDKDQGVRLGKVGDYYIFMNDEQESPLLDLLFNYHVPD